MPTQDKSGKTAIARKKLSAPMSWLLDNHLMPEKPNKNDRLRLLDYGCGRGSDVRILGGMKRVKRAIAAQGYDPNWEFDEDGFTSVYDDLWPPHKFDLVTCIYVLNVIRSPAGRRDVEDGILEVLKEGGRAFIAVRDDVKKTGTTSSGTWQGMVTPSKRWELLHRRPGGFRIYGSK